MAALEELVKNFYGRNPILGEEACIELIKNHGTRAIEALIPLDGSYSTSLQTEYRLKTVASALGPQIVPHLSLVISTGHWSSKLLAAQCFAGFQNTNDIEAPLIQILKTGKNFDAERLAIEALGFLGADGWAFEMERYVRSGVWESSFIDDSRNVSSYPFEKLSSYVLQAFARFAAKSDNRDVVSDRLFHMLSEFIKLRQSLLPYVGPDSYTLVAQIAEEFTQWSVDPIIKLWGQHSDDQMQQLCMTLLGTIAPLRAASFLLEKATSPEASNAVRAAASIALGEIRHPQAAQRLAKSLKDPSTDKTYLAYAFSTLYAVPADWPDVSDYIDELLAQDTEPACQLHYSLAIKGVDRYRSELIDRLDDKEPYKRWTAALALVRILGYKSREYLEHRAEDAGDDLERCGMYAAIVRAGDDSKVANLYAALQASTYLPRLRSVWKLEIIDTFRTVKSFDARAVPLWHKAAHVSTRQRQFFDTVSSFVGRRSDAISPELIPKKMADHSCGRSKVFISYSRRDKEWLERFQLMLSPLVRAGRVDLWDDTKIKPGKWLPQIEVALSESHIALFLVSANFLASEFIMQHELPDLLRYTQERDVKILWVLLDECLWEDTPLVDYQGENAGQALSLMSDGDRARIIKKTCIKIRESIGSPIE